jgi:TonB family protein
MKPALALILLLISPAASSAQDAELRNRAVTLLERAHAVSLAPNLPNLERVDTFRVFDPSATVREGSFSRVVIQGVGRREETTFGDYHVVNIWTGRTLVTTEEKKELAPAEVDTVMHLTPIYLVRFDQTDVIRAINDRGTGESLLHCIEFDTITGEKSRSNEICVDAANGTLASQRLGDDIIENAEFFPFAGALLPAKITYSVVNSGLRLEIAQTMTVLTEQTANVLVPPPDVRILQLCTTYRRAIGQSMPQPKPGNRSSDAEVVVRGIIGEDGKLHNALVQHSERPDLNSEALNVAAQWVFLPAMCNGKPNPSEATLVLHFRDR